MRKVSEVSNCTHHFIIDSSNVGHCKYCPAVRDFGKLLIREGHGLGLKPKRGGKKGKRVREKKEPANAKISAAATKRWQDPEYRAKMSGSKGRKPKYE